MFETLRKQQNVCVCRPRYPHENKDRKKFVMELKCLYFYYKELITFLLSGFIMKKAKIKKKKKKIESLLGELLNG